MSELLALTLFGSALYFYLAFFVLIIVCFVSEKVENGFYAFGCFVVFSVLLTIKGDFKPVLQLFHWHWFVAYLAIGFGHATWRFFYEGRKFGEKLESQRAGWAKKKEIVNRAFTAGEETNFRESVLESSRMQAPKASAFRWWFNWPVSLTYYIFSELVGNIWSHIWDNVKKFFTNIYEAGIKSGSKSVAKK